MTCYTNGIVDTMIPFDMNEQALHSNKKHILVCRKSLAQRLLNKIENAVNKL